MAKQKTRKKTPWKPSPDDAIRLAALRWFGLELEQRAIKIYATNRRLYPAMEAVLRQALKNMKALQLESGGGEEEECPPGYILCKDGFCAPMCDADPPSN